MRVLEALLVGVWLAGTASPDRVRGPQASPLRTGDVIFHTSRSSQSIAIQRATRSRYSHMGIIVVRRGHPEVFEAVGPVRYTPLNRWIARGDRGHYIVKRLRDADRLLGRQGERKRIEAATRFEGRPYDLTFEWSDDRLYCSELVWKVYDRALGVRIGRLQQLRDFDLTHPLVRQKMKQRYGARIPWTEPVISPAEMFASNRLIEIGRR